MKGSVKITLGIILLMAIGSAFVFVDRMRPEPAPILPPIQRYQPQPATSTAPQPSKPVPAVPTSTTTVTTTAALIIPEALRLDVPFIPQAPKQNWDMPYQEACEEASVLMVNAYYANEEKNPTPDEADRRILDLVKWTADTYGPELIDTTATQTAAIAKQYFTNIDAKAVPFQDATQIKRYLAQGYPVIVAADGKTLPNPNFRNGGPIYHMLVVKGYTADGQWITNDPGTRKGENFLYQEQALIDSIRDWNGGKVSEAKPMLLILKPSSL